MGSDVFNHIANDYDKGFTYSKVGSAQRERVFYFFDQLHQEVKQGLRIFELNGGTGEDACLLAERGHEVLTSDVSAEMVSVSNQKIQQRNVSARAKAMVFDLDSKEWPSGPFDLIWSNFGGLNCLSDSELSRLSIEISNSTNSGGHFFAVVMSDKCIWEVFFYSLKLDFKRAFRRFGGGRVDASIGKGKTIPTWYYSDRHFASLFSKEFDRVGSYPIGFLIPPSYLENKMNEFPLVFKFLKWADYRFRNWSWLSRFSDHFLVIMKKR